MWSTLAEKTSKASKESGKGCPKRGQEDLPGLTYLVGGNNICGHSFSSV